MTIQAEVIVLGLFGLLVFLEDLRWIHIVLLGSVSICDVNVEDSLGPRADVTLEVRLWQHASRPSQHDVLP